MSTVHNRDLDKRKCQHCDTPVLVITIEPPDDPTSVFLTTGVWVESLDDEINPFVLCDHCADELYNAGRLGYTSTGAFLV